MRTIKFRGKRIKHNKWVYGMPLPSQFGCGYMLNIDAAMDADFYHSRYTMPTFESTPDINEDTIGQFTGLRDRNGIEIYEGDIFNLGSKDILYKVVWRDCGLCGKQIHSSSYVGLSFWLQDIEIVGNIYDNPELIKR